ncbi:hypothetical protein RHS01_07375 [Rhizoctonia solani]|uniref:Uncharacterized protein n=1 Tax=Rhizoctonia solani TaxID=456999 RepID=A0A8H7I9T2_9AGAM|nr:hypothetical protein RHS01_07375 [Rhizoctonia solani]
MGTESFISPYGYQLSQSGLQLKEAGNIVALLNEFRKFRDGWLYLKLGKPLMLESADPDMRLYELGQGYYAAALSTSFALPGVIKLTNLHNGSSTKLSLGVQFSEFQIDMSQELLALVAIEAHVSSSIYLRSSDTGHSHPAALHPDWTVQLPFNVERRSSGIFVEIMDELLAVKYVSIERDVSNILIWNWKSGLLLNRIECLSMSCTFGFLGTDSLLLSQSIKDAGVNVVVYTNVRSASVPSPDSRAVFDISQYPMAKPSFEFGFPEFSQGAHAYLLMRSEPAPTLGSTGPAKFMPRPSSRIVQLSMSVVQSVGPQRGLRQYHIFLSKTQILKCMKMYDDAPTAKLGPGSEADSESPIRIPWERWGEYATRWFGTPAAMSPWICRTHGTRFIQAHPYVGDDDGGNEHPLEYLSVLEFHQQRFDEWPSSGATSISPCGIRSKGGSTSIGTVQTRCSKDDAVFVDIIDETVPSYTPFNGQILVTRLPYRIVTRRRPVPKHSGWMMDNNLIIGMPSWQGDELENMQNEHMTIYTPMA